MWEGKVDLELWRERMERVNEDSESMALTRAGPRFPPAFWCGLSILIGVATIEGEKGTTYTDDDDILQ